MKCALGFSYNDHVNESFSDTDPEDWVMSLCTYRHLLYNTFRVMQVYVIKIIIIAIRYIM